MKPEIKAKAEKQVSRSLAKFISLHPFFAALLMPMEIVADDSGETKTLATDGDSVFYSPEFVAALTQEETLFALAHETLHVVFDHMGRRGKRTPNRWNQAADYVINQVLLDEKIGDEIPQFSGTDKGRNGVSFGGILKNQSLVDQGKGTAEGVYTLLPESAEKNGAGGKGGAMDTVNDSGSKQGKKKSDAATIKQKSADIGRRVAQARNCARMQGELSAGLERIVTEFLKPVVDWKEALRNFLSERAKQELTFARPKRRFASEDFLLPSLGGVRMGKLAVAVDCSGSVSPKLLEKFAAEINAIREDIAPSEIDVYYFDSRVLREEKFSADDTFSIRAVGGGGTRFSPVFEAINAKEDLPTACVFLTDLCCSDFGPAPDYPVLWAVLEGGLDSAPFGEVLQVRETE